METNEKNSVLTKKQKQLLKRIERCLDFCECLTGSEDLEILDLPEDVWESHLLPYLEENPICVAAEVKIFNLPQDKIVRLLSSYLKGHDDNGYFYDEAQVLYDNLPEKVKEKIRANI